MQIEINDHTTPPGGWQFYQPQTGWAMPNPISVTLSQATTLLLQHRMKNPAVAQKFGLILNADQVKEEIKAFQRKRLNIPEPSLPKSSLRRPLPQVVGDAVAAVVKTASGAAFMLDWEMSNLPPVSPDRSARRALQCAQGDNGNPCPHNQKGDFTRWYTVPVSEMLRKRIERLKNLDLKTPYDDSINVCTACECPLRTKVHGPLELILKNLKPAAREALWPKCWILSEEKEHANRTTTDSN